MRGFSNNMFAALVCIDPVSAERKDAERAMNTTDATKGHIRLKSIIITIVTCTDLLRQGINTGEGESCIDEWFFGSISYA
jgi:hypothetical protein